MRLVEQELSQNEDKWRFIGVLPIRDRKALEQPSSPGGSTMSSPFTQGRFHTLYIPGHGFAVKMFASLVKTFTHSAHATPKIGTRLSGLEDSW